jgi:acyl carrier protein
MSTETKKEIGNKIVFMVKEMQGLTDEEVKNVAWDKNLMEQVGFDSLRAFGMVTSLHEMMGVELPEEMDPNSVMSIDGISKYIIDNYDQAVVNSVLSKSEQEIQEMISGDDDFDDL